MAEKLLFSTMKGNFMLWTLAAIVRYLLVLLNIATIKRNIF